jgi:hypothetical protein
LAAVKGGDLAEEAEGRPAALGLEVRMPLEQSGDSCGLSFDILNGHEQSHKQRGVVEASLGDLNGQLRFRCGGQMALSEQMAIEGLDELIGGELLKV